LEDAVTDTDSSRKTWQPTEQALTTARAINNELVDIPIHIARYTVVKAEKHQQPSSAEWLRWYLADAQEALVKERKAQAAAGKARPWHHVAD
jgi:hypothetical protein